MVMTMMLMMMLLLMMLRMINADYADDDAAADAADDEYTADGDANIITGYSKMPRRIPRNLLKPPKMYTQTQYQSYCLHHDGNHIA